MGSDLRRHAKKGMVIIMDIAVLSDIHGNHVALEACVKYAVERGIDTFVFLGDYLGEMAYPEKTMAHLYRLKEQYTCYFIKGNKEDYWIKHHLNNEIEWPDNNSASGSLHYTYERLTDRDFRFFESMVPSAELKPSKELPAFIACHGSPRNAYEKMLPDERTYQLMEHASLPLILCGHTHIPGELTYNGCHVVNAGSVGVALDGSAHAQFLLLHGIKNAWSWEFLSIPYDTRQVLTELKEEQLHLHAPFWCHITKQLLNGSTVSHGTVLSLAMELCRQNTGCCEWPDIPEHYWEQACCELLPIPVPSI